MASIIGSLDAKPEQQSSKRLLAGGASCGLCTRLRTEVQATDTCSLLAKARSWPSLSISAGWSLTGEAVPIAEGMGQRSSTPVFGLDDRRFGLSDRGSHGSAGTITQLTWFDREGKPLATAGEPGLYNTVALSPDGTRVAVSRVTPRSVGRGGRPPLIYGYTSSRAALATRLTSDPASDWLATWSPDGSRIIFSSERDGPCPQPVSEGCERRGQ